MVPPPTTEIRLILSDSYYFFLRNIVQIASMCLPFLLATAVFEIALSGSYEPANTFQIGPFMPWIFHLFVYPIYTAALILLMAKQAKGEFPQNMELVAAALKVWRPFFILSLFQMILIGGGLFLFLIPGLWIAVKLSFSEFFLVVDGLNPKEAMSRSFMATRHYFWVILVSLSIAFLPVGLTEYVVYEMTRRLSDPFMLEAFGGTIGSFLKLFMDVVVFRIFMAVVLEKPEALPPHVQDLS